MKWNISYIINTIVKYYLNLQRKQKKLYYKEVFTKSKNKMKTTWNIIYKETTNLTNENNIKSLRINNHIASTCFVSSHL